MGNVLFSSKSVEWSSPDDLFQKRHKIHKFEIDVAATAENAKLPRFITREMNTFLTSWTVDVLIPESGGLTEKRPARCWFNPPYGKGEKACRKLKKSGEYRCNKKVCQPASPDNPNGRGYHIDVDVPGLDDFVKLAYERAGEGCLVDCLLPANTDVKWWFDYVWDDELDQPKPFVRVKFLKGRKKFGGMKSPAPFASTLVTFLPRRA